MHESEKKHGVDERIHALLVDRFGDELAAIGPEDPLQEAGLDSVDMLDALAGIEKLFQLTFDRDELIGIACLDELYELVYDKLIETHGEKFELP